MTNYIDPVLQDYLHPEQYAVMEETARVLTNLGSLAFYDELQQIIGMHDGISDTTLLTSRLHDLFVITVGDLLHKHGVEVVDDTPLPLMTSLLDVIASLTDYLIPTHLLDLLQSDAPDEERLAEAVSLLMVEDTTELLDTLVHVDPVLLNRLEDHLSEQTRYEVPETTQDPALIQDRVRTINALCRQLGEAGPTVVYTLAKNGIPPGQSLTTLIDITVDILDTHPTSQLSIELYAIALYSNEFGIAPHPLMTKAVDAYTDDYDEQVRLVSALPTPIKEMLL